MFRLQLEAWLKAQGRSYSISGKEIKTKCLNPEHQDNNPSFSINYATGLAYCFSCSYKSHANIILGLKPDEDQVRISKYLELNRMWEQDVSEDEPPVSIELPPRSNIILGEVRGIPKAMIDELGVYLCDHGRYKGRLIFPVRDTRGNLLGFDARIWDESGITPNIPEAKYLRPTSMSTKNCLYPLDYLFNHRNDLDLTSIVLTEGIFDALSYIALGVPAVANFGLAKATVTKAGQILSLGTMELCLGFDADTAGINTTPEVKDSWRPYLPIGKVNNLTKAIYSSGIKDANDYLLSLTKA